jgi:hypothetical protein
MPDRRFFDLARFVSTMRGVLFRGLTGSSTAPKGR